MGRIRAWRGSAERWLRQQSAIFLVLLIIAVIGVMYTILRALNLDADSVAAAAGALAAIAAMIAARQSAATAKDATRALAFATKPMPVVRPKIERSETQPGMCSIAVEIENISVHPLRGGTLSWVLRDGTSGTCPVGEIRGRSTPFGGMLHRAQGVEEFLLTPAFDVAISGADKIVLDYWGETRSVHWRTTKSDSYKVLTGQTWVKDGVDIPATECTKSLPVEVEL
ncbi:hypothetical protein SAMN04489743_2858 [Pseudarthrobacter equi]|uniref:Uncharacterized protein n=1 Tax=Pseudarthrobacter equi TaxID=728066 RepID=A0A1H2A9H9_9MICC|nr:hypothetical protein [Pseudarthrobacter equi]SDT42533.1 hypothetical protein SAMN04489743_2858 [Pseudarthrobacter equi]